MFPKLSRQLNLIQTTSIYFSFCPTMIWQNFFSELDAYVQVDTCNHGIVFHRAQCALHSSLQYEETRNLGSQTFYYLAIFHSHSMLGYVSPIPGRKRVRPVVLPLSTTLSGPSYSFLCDYVSYKQPGILY